MADLSTSPASTSPTQATATGAPAGVSFDDVSPSPSMSAQPVTATPDQLKASGVTFSGVDVPNNVVYDQDNDRTVSLPQGLTADETGFMLKKHVDGIKNFFGFQDTGGFDALGKDLMAVSSIISPVGFIMNSELGQSNAKGVAGGIISMGQIPPVLAKEAAETVGGDYFPDQFKGQHAFSKFGPDDLAGAAFKYVKDAVIKSVGTDEVIQKSNELIARNKKFMADAGIDGTNLTGANKLMYDLGSGETTLIAGMGMTALTKNPALAATYFGILQQTQTYQEARQLDPSTGKPHLEAGDAVKLANLDGTLNAAMEFVGLDHFFKALRGNTAIRKIVQGFIIEGTQEAGQQAENEAVTQAAGIRKSSMSDTIKNILYNGLIGGIVGSAAGGAHHAIFSNSEEGKPALTLTVHPSDKNVSNNVYNAAIQSGVPEATAHQMADYVDNNVDNAKENLPEFLDKELSPMAQDPDAAAKFMEYMKQFGDGHTVQSRESLNPEDRARFDAYVQNFDKANAVNEGLGKVDAQEGRGFIPVPKRVQNLSEFIKEQGGLKLDTEEAQRFSRKNSPALKGVAHKNGTLSLDEARAKAVEAGYLQDTSYEGGVSISDEQQLLNALDREAGGDDVVRSEDMEDHLSRQQILEYNAQLDEAHGHIMASEKPLKSFRSAFKEGVRAAKKDVKAAQAAAIDALNKTNLRPEDKAKFISTIKNIQTSSQLEKAAPDIERRVAGLITADTKRGLRNQIKKRLKAAKKSELVSADTKENAKRIEAKLEDAGILNGDIAYPEGATKEDIDEIKKERRDRYQNLSVDEFKNALDEVNSALAQGKAKLEIMNEQRKERMAQRLEDLAADSTPIDNRDLKDAPLGERLTVLDKLKNIFTEGLNKAQRLNLNKNPMDVIFDIMDGAKDYAGANSRIFKRKIDNSHSNYLQLKERQTRDVKNLADKLGLDDRNFNRIGAYAVAQQEGGIDRLIASGISEAEIENLVLTPKEQEMYDLMRAKLDEMVPALKDVMLNVYNKEFTGVKDYFPFMTDFKKMNSAEIQNMFGDDAFQIDEKSSNLKKKDVDKGFTKERTGGKQAVRIDAMGVFMNHIDNASYLIEMGQDIKELGTLAISDDFRDIAGDLGQSITIDWLDLLARKGNAQGQIDALNTLRKHAGAATLGFKLSSALIQPTSLMDGASFVGGSYVARGMVNITQPEWREFIFNNMPEIRERVGDDPEYLNMGGDGIIADVREAGFWALQKLDTLAASAVASAAYTKSVESRGGEVDLSDPDPVALQDAQLAVRRTQSSSFAKDAAPILSQGKLTGNVSLDKTILQFQSFVLNRWSLIQHDMVGAGIMKGRTKKALNIATWLLLAQLSEYYIRHWTAELIGAITGHAPPPDEDPAWEIAGKQLLSNVPFVSSFLNSAQYGSTPVPAEALRQKVFQELSYAEKSKKEDKKIKHYGSAGILAAGAFTGMPGALQAQSIFSNIVSSGEDKGGKKSKNGGKDSRRSP